MNTAAKTDFLDLHGIRIPRGSLETHMLVTGTTGSGKSRGIIRPIIQQALAQGDAAIVMDVKGDLLPMVREALMACGRERDLAVLGIGSTDHVFNPLAEALDPAQLANQLIRASALTGPSASDRLGGDDLYWSTARNELLTALVELARNLALAGKTAAPLSLQSLQKLRPKLTQLSFQMEAWVKESAEFLSEAGASALKEFASLPDNTKACVMTSVTNLLAPFFRRPLSLLIQPSTDRPVLNLRDIIDRSMVMVVTAGQAEHAADLLPGFLLFKSALYRMILCRSRLPVRQDNRILVVLDEYNRLVLSHDFGGSEHVALESARSSRTSFVLATQNLSGLEAIAGPTLIDKISALCGSLVFLSNSCSVTARLAEKCLGVRTRFQRHLSQAQSLPPPLLIPGYGPRDHNQNLSTMLVPVQEPVVSATKLARLRPGEGYIKLADGRVHRLKCRFE